MDHLNYINEMENNRRPDSIDKIIRKKTKDNQIIRKHLKELKIIIQCISDGLIVLDRYSRIHLLNDAARNFFYKPQAIRFHGDEFQHANYYDMNGRLLKPSEMVGSRTLNGETITNERIKVVRPDKTMYCSINGNPVYDDNKELLFAVVCIRDITENMLNYERIAEQRENLLKLEKEKNEALSVSLKRKDDFLYLITHEFRTPISVVNSALQAIDILCKDDITHQISKYLKTIKQNTFRQLRLVNNLLENIRLDSSLVKFNFSEFDIVFVTKEIVKSVELYSRQKGILLEFNSRLSKKNVIFDEEKYERILLNLLSNALKFTQEGKVTVSLFIKSKKHRQMICVSVKDEGIGIPKAMQQVIFERFGQADSILSRTNEGTGIGLHLVKQIVASLEGELTLESDEGKGSCFTVFLPVMKNANRLITHENRQSSSADSSNRIEQAVSIEFSDIYNN